MELDNFPEKPGVYLMKNNDVVIYVGKAKNLKRRVSSYFNRHHEDNKTKELVKNIENIDYIICNSELDALILENNLIKKYNPKFNILLKDKKTYPYLKISKEKFPKLSITRSTKDLDEGKGEYYGPYPFGGINLKKTLLNLLKIRDCNRDMEKIYDRPCLRYYMKTCLGPCKYKNIDEEYNKNIEILRKILKGNGQEVIKDLEEKMKIAGKNMEFERAIVYREQKNKIEMTLKNQIIDMGRDLDEDTFTFIVENERCFIYGFNIREGKILGNQSIEIDLKNKIYENINRDILFSYYEKFPIPKEIILSEIYSDDKEVIEEYLTLKKKKKVQVTIPKAGRKKELLNMTFKNLLEFIERYYLKKDIVEEGLKKLYNKLNLKKFPIRIECFDISNIQGKDAVASMSVALWGKSSKKNYRKFKIRSKDTPDDFQMMREVIERRYGKLDKRDFPDLILIDGGLGQINAVGKILEDLDKLQYVDLISIAKKEELIFKYGESEPYIFSHRDESLKILQRLRDEAHRFGITYHRLLRSKRIISSQLDEVEGIGPKRRELLLKKYGSVEKIKKVTVEELSEVIPEKIAINLKKKLQGD